jgi:hypothetical protein
MYTCNISLNSYWNEKCFRQNIYNNQNMHFTFNNFLPKIVQFMTKCSKFCAAGTDHRGQHNKAQDFRMLDN